MNHGTADAVILSEGLCSVGATSAEEARERIVQLRPGGLHWDSRHSTRGPANSHRATVHLRSRCNTFARTMTPQNIPVSSVIKNLGDEFGQKSVLVWSGLVTSVTLAYLVTLTSKTLRELVPAVFFAGAVLTFNLVKARKTALEAWESGKFSPILMSLLQVYFSVIVIHTVTVILFRNAYDPPVGLSFLLYGAAAVWGGWMKGVRPGYRQRAAALLDSQYREVHGPPEIQTFGDPVHFTLSPVRADNALEGSLRVSKNAPTAIALRVDLEVSNSDLGGATIRGECLIREVLPGAVERECIEYASLPFRIQTVQMSAGKGALASGYAGIFLPPGPREAMNAAYLKYALQLEVQSKGRRWKTVQSIVIPNLALLAPEQGVESR